MHNDKHSSQDDRMESASVSPYVNEAGSVNVSGYIRVFDPQTQEVLVEVRE